MLQALSIYPSLSPSLSLIHTRPPLSLWPSGQGSDGCPAIMSLGSTWLAPGFPPPHHAAKWARLKRHARHHSTWFNLARVCPPLKVL